MKNIEIKTTQNVVLQYELASLRDRIIAFVIDFICLAVGIWLLALAGFGLFYFSGTLEILYIILLSSLFIFYSPIMEIKNHGQSVGKMAMRIQVIKTVGGYAAFSDYMARWAFRIIDIYLSFGGIASILVASSSKAQRLGDIVANTAVVKLVPKMDLKLNDLLAIHSKDSYHPVYLQAKQLQEEDVLLIKTTLDRHRKFNNEAHHEALFLLSTKIKEVLNIKEEPGKDRQFLQTILNDYVVLTR